MLRLTYLTKRCASLEMASILANRARVVLPVPQMAFITTKTTKSNKTVKGVEPPYKDIDVTSSGPAMKTKIANPSIDIERSSPYTPSATTTGQSSPQNPIENLVENDDRDFESSKVNQSSDSSSSYSSQSTGSSQSAGSSQSSGSSQDTSYQPTNDSHERTATEYIKDATEKVKDATMNVGHKVWETAGKAASVATHLAFDATESIVKSFREGDEVIMSSKPKTDRDESGAMKTQAREAAQEMVGTDETLDSSGDLKDVKGEDDSKYEKVRDNLFDYLSEKTVESQKSKPNDKQAATEASERERDQPNTRMAEEKDVGEIAKKSAKEATSKSSKPNVSIGVKDSTGSYEGYGNSSGSTEGNAPAGYEATSKTPPNYVGAKPPKMAENPSMKESDIPSYGYATEDWVEDDDKATMPIKNINSGFETEREAMSSLMARGFNEKFDLGDRKVSLPRLGKSFDLENVSIMEVHGFRGERDQDPSQNCIYMAIEATSSDDGHTAVYKGIVETTYGKLKSSDVQSLVERATDKRESVEKKM